MADRAMNEGRLQNIRDAVADGTANIDDARELLAELTELRLLWEALNAERRTEAPMADRLTPKREAEIRQPRTRTLDWAPQVYEEWDDERADLIAELDAVRAEREAARVERLRAVRESEAHSLVRTELHRQLGHHMAQGAMVESLTERALAAEARVRELEAVLSTIDKAHAGNKPSVTEMGYATLKAERERDEARAEVATLRAQMATLREAASAVLSVDAPPTEYSGCFAECSSVDHSAACVAYDQAHAALRAALAEPGPTLASIEAAAQARLLREMAMQWSDEDDGEPRGTKDVVQWLHARADELEGKR